MFNPVYILLFIITVLMKNKALRLSQVLLHLMTLVLFFFRCRKVK